MIFASGLSCGATGAPTVFDNEVVAAGVDVKFDEIEWKSGFTRRFARRDYRNFYAGCFNLYRFDSKKNKGYCGGDSRFK